MPRHTRKAAVVDYWRLIELFSAALPIPTPDAGQEPGTGFCLRAEKALPWEESGASTMVSPPTGKIWHFHVYCGIYGHEKIESALTALHQPLPDKVASDVAARCGDDCLFGFAADASGKFLPNTHYLSPRAWVTGRSRIGGVERAEWQQPFESTVALLARDFSGRTGEKTIAYDDLLAATCHAANMLGMPELGSHIEIRIAAVAIDANAANDISGVGFGAAIRPEIPLAAELDRIAHALRNQAVGRGLRDYLASSGEIGEEQRVNVNTSPLFFFQHLAPPLISAAHWPAKNTGSIHQGEQFAVNSVLKNLQRGTGLFAIEAESEPEKSAVLRDIVAAVVVERATRLAQLGQPDQAFVGERRWRALSSGSMHGDIGAISLWSKELRGFEVVLACADKAGASQAVTDISHHAHAFLSLYGESRDADEIAGEYPLAAHAKSGGLVEDCLKIMTAKDGLSPRKAVEAWIRAVADFRQAVAEEQRLRLARSSMFDDFVALGNALQEIDLLEARLTQIAARESAAQIDLDTASATMRVAAEDLTRTEERRRIHAGQRPPLSAIFFSLGDDLQEWRIMGRSHALGYEHAARRLAEAEIRVECRRRTLAAIESERNREETQLADLHKRAAALRAAQDDARKRIGAAHPAVMKWDPVAASLDHPAPWSDSEWRKARCHVFAEALRLHRVFVAANAPRLERNLKAAQAALGGHAPGDVLSEVVEEALASLFFIVPVLSLDLEEFRQGFSRLRREAVGWLLLDEAGRMPARAALGAIWRARRIVSFGDATTSAPREEMPQAIDMALRRQLGIGDASLPVAGTAQQLAVRSCRQGSWQEAENDRIWAGIPLRRDERQIPVAVAETATASCAANVG